MCCYYFVDLRNKGAKKRGSTKEKEDAIHLKQEKEKKECEFEAEAQCNARSQTRSPSVVANISPAVADPVNKMN
jgi:hypothetical protein